MLGLLLSVLCLSAIGQGPTPIEWKRLESKNCEFSIKLPGELAVFLDTESDRAVVMASATDASFQVTMWNAVDGKKMLDQAVKSRYGMPGEGKLSVVGKHEVVFVFVSKNAFNAELNIGNGKAYYSLKMSAKAANEIVAEVMNSILLDGVPLLKQSQASTQNKTDGVISVKDLKTSIATKDAGKGKKGNPSLVKDDSDFAAAYPDVFLSRHLMMVKKERPRYTDDARINNIQGEVIVHVEYMSDGTIGRIAVKKGLGGGLTQEAVNAAQKIVFVPAQVNGQNITTSGFHSYFFSIL